MFKVALIAVLVQLTIAQNYGGPARLVAAPTYGAPSRLVAAPAYAPAAYAPAPARLVAAPAYAAPVRAAYAEPISAPQPYTFGYDVDNGDGNGFRQQEEGDSYGNKKGSYSYQDAYGVYRTVDYVADENGFRATIRTNEPGTAPGANPADVQLDAIPPPAQVYLPVKAAPLIAAPAYAPAPARLVAAPAYAPAPIHAAPLLAAPAYAPEPARLVAAPAYAPAPARLVAAPLKAYQAPAAIRAPAPYRAAASAPLVQYADAY